MKKTIGLRKRWLRNTVGVIAVLGLVFVLLATGVYAYYRYSQTEKDLRQRAEATAEYFAAHSNQNYEEFYGECVAYVRTFTDRDSVELQLLDANGKVEASSQITWVGSAPDTSEIADAREAAATYVGFDTMVGQRVMALSSPVIYNGQSIGIFRYVIATEQMDLRILWFGTCVLACLAAMLWVIIMVNGLYIQSVINPI